MRAPYIKTAGALALAAVLIIGWAVHSLSFARFAAADRVPGGILLHYDGPMAKDVLVPQESIDAVLFGLPGKSNRQCYIKIRLKSGESYRSVTFDSELDACKRLRQDLSLARKEIP